MAPAPTWESSPVDLDDIRITVARDGDACRVDVAGDLSSFGCKDLAAQLRSAIKDGAVHVDLDLAGVDFLDSSGIQCIVHARNLAADYGGRLKVVAVSDPARRVLEVTGLLAPFTSGDPI
jgi:anti-sigma B factor antagonist